MSGAAAAVVTDLLGLVVMVPLLLLVEAALWLAILAARAAESGVGACMGWCHTMVREQQHHTLVLRTSLEPISPSCFTNQPIKQYSN